MRLGRARIGQALLAWLIGGCSLFSDADELSSNAPGRDAGKSDSGKDGSGVDGAGAWANGGSSDSGFGGGPSGGTSGGSAGSGASGGSAGSGGGTGNTGGVGATGATGGTDTGGSGGSIGCGVCPAGTVCNSLTATCVACGAHGGPCCDPPAQCGGDSQCCAPTGLSDHKCYACALEPAQCLCLVCCAVCQGGTIKSTPLPVNASETCDQVANQWCIGKGVPNGANPTNSGWKNSCQ